MKNRYSNYWALLGIIFCLCFQLAQAQNVPQSLGTCANLVDQFKQTTSAATLRGSQASLSLKVSSQKSFSGTVTYSKSENGGTCAIGQLDGIPTSTFMITVTPSSIHGHILIMSTKKAYQYSSDAKGNAFITEVGMDKIICTDYNPVPPKKEKSVSKSEAVVNSPAIFTLESLHGAPGCIYLDFDGETVSGTGWNNGATIVAAPSGMSDDLIRECWEIVSEDYRAFNLNVTTNVNVFNTYPKNMRIKHITTTSKDVTTTGVAFLGSFTWNDDTPSWGTYTDSGKISGEVAAHEVGHTFNLSHDGRELPTGHEEYFAGTSGGLAAPIMGAGYYNPVTQWSKGDYYSAPSNTQDDLAIISGTPGIGYRTDAQGNTIATAAALVISSSGAVTTDQNFGIIEKTTDLDFFSFTTSGGTVQLNVNTVSRDGDLNIEVKLYNASGGLMGTFNPAGTVGPATPNLNASFTQSLSAGKYYISVDGTGDGDPYTNGFSEYASLGSYTISGTVPNVAVTLRTPENPAVTVTGLDYKYYEGNWGAVPNFSTLTPVKTGTTVLPDLSGRNKDDQFGFSYTGYVSVPTDGTYSFYTTSDDGSQLFIGTTMVVNNDGLHGAQESSGTIGLKAGKHAITILFFEQGGDQVLSTSYAGPGINKQTIPTASFLRVPPTIATFYKDCNFGGYAVGLEAGSFTTAQMVARGILDNDVSSLKVSAGYEVVLYELDNFGGASQTFSADNSCLVNNAINDWASSIKVRVATTPPANILPTVSLTSPTANATFSAPATVTISANASDSDGTISKVDFYNGTTLISSDASSPYGISWTGVVAGTYSITAKATDNSGGVSTSGAVTIVVQATTATNILPTVSLTSPSAGATFTAPASITLSANASDQDGSISKVDFYNGSTLINTDATSPYSVVWSGVAAGTYSITAKATDNSGGVSTTIAISITVNTVSVTNSCTGVPSYVENSGYAPGSITQNAGSRYQCKPWPYSGWCNGAAWAYAPGTGTYWTDAWTSLGSCASGAAEVGTVEESVLTNAPNPFAGATSVDVTVEAAGTVSLKVYDKTGKLITVLNDGYLSVGKHSFELNGSSLIADVYIVRYESNNQVIVRKIVKAQ